MKKITKNFIAQFLPDNPVIVEAGAHKGRNTIAMSNLWPNATIHAFEPTEMYEQLIANTKTHLNIYTYKKALDAIAQRKTLYACLGKYTQLSSLCKPSEYFTKNPRFAFEEITTQTITLDQWAENYQIPNVDLIWLDAQGAELNILKGGSGILKNVKLLFMEANVVERYENAACYDQLKRWVEDHNFHQIAADDEILNNRFNVLFIKKEA